MQQSCSSTPAHITIVSYIQLLVLRLVLIYLTRVHSLTKSFCFLLWTILWRQAGLSGSTFSSYYNCALIRLASTCQYFPQQMDTAKIIVATIIIAPTTRGNRNDTSDMTNISTLAAAPRTYYVTFQT